MNSPGKQRILVVDDEPVMRTITQTVLAQHEFDVIVAESAEEAFELIGRGELPDLLLLDVLMPGMNGFDACRALRRQHHLEHLPIIMLTALDDQASIDEAYRCGATDFITKPLNMPLLPHRVRYLLRSAQAFKELMDSQENLINTQQIAHLGNWMMDEHGAVVNASRQYLDIIGASMLPVPKERLLARVHREDRAALVRGRTELKSGRSYRLDYRLRGLHDESTWFHVHEMGFPRFGDVGEYLGASGFIQDITQRVEQEEKIRQLAWHDSLTGLYNRNRLLELLDRDLNNAETPYVLALLFIHFDHLRQIAMVAGQEIADTVIKVQASRLSSLLDASTEDPGKAMLGAAALARYDEQSLIVALPGQQDHEVIRRLAEAICETLARPVFLGAEEFLSKPFIGISCYPEDATDSQELMRRATLVALRAARSEGATVNFFDPEHDREAMQRMVMERSLRVALEQGNELLPFLQPKISARTGQVLGAEVLLRWQHPLKGLVSPAQFIPLAEETGLIHPISEWLISHVCEMLARWQQKNPNLGCISINLSAHSFFDRTLVQFVDEVLYRTGVAPSQLIVELTETVLMQDTDAANRVIASLRQRGIRISLDDFGTGFSSLGYLNRFDIDEIKIDRSFVLDLEADRTAQALVQAIISLGHALGLEVVAEGVETEAQASLLRQMGCDIFQGFLFARPMPAGDFPAFVEARQGLG